MRRIQQVSNHPSVWHHLLHQFQALSAQTCTEYGHAGEVAARLIEARHETNFDWI
jgi:hypothetical protein